MYEVEIFTPQHPEPSKGVHLRCKTITEAIERTGLFLQSLDPDTDFDSTVVIHIVEIHNAEAMTDDVERCPRCQSIHVRHLEAGTSNIATSAVCKDCGHIWELAPKNTGTMWKEIDDLVSKQWPRRVTCHQCDGTRFDYFQREYDTDPKSWQSFARCLSCGLEFPVGPIDVEPCAPGMDDIPF